MNDLFAALAGFGRGRLERQDRRIAEEQRAFENKQREEAMALEKRRTDEMQRQFNAELDRMYKFFEGERDERRLDRAETRFTTVQNLILAYQQLFQTAKRNEADIWSIYNSGDIQNALAQDSMQTSSLQRVGQMLQNEMADLNLFKARMDAPNQQRLSDLEVTVKEMLADAMRERMPHELAMLIAKRHEGEAQARIAEADAYKAESIAPIIVDIAQKTALPTAWAELSLKLAQERGINTEADMKQAMIDAGIPEAQASLYAAQTFAAWKDGEARAAQTALIQGTGTVPEGLQHLRKEYPTKTVWATAVNGLEQEIRELRGTAWDKTHPALTGMGQTTGYLSDKDWAAYAFGGEVVIDGKKQKVEVNEDARATLSQAQRLESVLSDAMEYGAAMGWVAKDETASGGDMGARRQKFLEENPKYNAPAQGRPGIASGFGRSSMPADWQGGEALRPLTDPMGTIRQGADELGIRLKWPPTFGQSSMPADWQNPLRLLLPGLGRSSMPADWGPSRERP